MTEPDEAVLYAQHKAMQRMMAYFDGDEVAAAAEIETEDGKEAIRWFAEDYRAGQAASAERIKALEEALQPYAFPNGSDTPLGDEFNRNRARALLKEADQ